MIITELYDGQGLGNQLWVYAASRSIAEQLDVPFVLLGAERFKGNGFLEIETAVGIDAEAVSEAIKEGEFKHFHEMNFYDPDLKYISSGFDHRVLSLKGANKLDGLFQSEKYFFGDLARFKDYFRLDNEVKKKNSIGDDTCIINLRGGEYKRHKNFILPESYWKAGIENIKKLSDVRNFLVVTDDVRYARSMFTGFDVLEGCVGDCYASIYNAKNLIISNSSFAYFPIKTSGNSANVIAPRYWARFGNEYNRWASVANLYESWLWQGGDGRLASYEECLEECQLTEAEYEAKYYIRTTQEQVHNPGIRRFLPAGIRKGVKSALSKFFPKHYG